MGDDFDVQVILPFVKIEQYDDKFVIVTRDGICEVIRKPQLSIGINQTRLSTISIMRFISTVEPILNDEQIPNQSLSLLNDVERKVVDAALNTYIGYMCFTAGGRPILPEVRHEVDRIKSLLGLVGEDDHSI